MLFIICNVLNLSRKSVNINHNSLHNIYEAMSSFWIVNCDVKLIFSVGCESFNFLSLLPKKKKKKCFFFPLDFLWSILQNVFQNSTEKDVTTGTDFLVSTFPQFPGIISFAYFIFPCTCSRI